MQSTAKSEIGGSANKFGGERHHSSATRTAKLSKLLNMCESRSKERKAEHERWCSGQNKSNVHVHHALSTK
jgi:hypothetical protein